jgi:CHAT domain-containing protein/tetratricopeptide (TPR) repeat protein
MAVMLAVLLAWIALSAETRGRSPAPRRSASAPSDAERSPDHDRRAAIVDSLERLGHLGEAVARARESAEALEARGTTGAALVDAWERLGRLQIDQGENLEAIEALEKALRHGRVRRDFSGSRRAAVLVTLAQAEKNRGLYAASERHYDEALGLALEAGDAGLLVRARALCGKAHLTRRTPAGLVGAEKLLREALRVGMIAAQPREEEVANIRIGLALVLLQRGFAAEAESLLDQSVPVAMRGLAPDHPDVGLAMSLWGWSHYLQGRFEDAEHCFRRAMTTYERARHLVDRGSNRRKLIQRVAVNLAGSQLAQGRGEAAWLALEEGLSSYLVDRLAPQDRGDSPAVDPHGDVQSPGRLTVQAELDANTAIVGWLDVNLVNESPTDTWGFVLRDHGRVHWVKFPRGAASENPFETAGAGLQAALQRDSAWPVRVPADANAEEARRAVWDARMAPLVRYLDGVDHLIAVNAWTRQCIPIEIFVDPEGRSLIERYDVTYAPSSRVYAALRERRRRATSRPRATSSLLVADGSPRNTATSGKRLAAIPGVEREVGVISKVLPFALVLRGRDARAESIRDLARTGQLGSFNVLHFATHATFDPRIPGFAAIVLGPGTDLLTAAEIEQWRLGGGLAVLSGCRTSGAQFLGTSPGLAEGFLVAGASGVVVSLWSVDDRATSFLMERFYRNITAGEGRNAAPEVSAALRDAKLWLRDLEDQRGGHPYRNPAYWAGFVYIGARD